MATGIPGQPRQGPTEPEDTDGFEDEDGLPRSGLTGQRRGFRDNFDNCTNDPRTWDGFADRRRLPDRQTT